METAGLVPPTFTTSARPRASSAICSSAERGTTTIGECCGRSSQSGTTSAWAGSSMAAGTVGAATSAAWTTGGGEGGRGGGGGIGGAQHLGTEEDLPVEPEAAEAVSADLWECTHPRRGKTRRFP